MEYTFDDGTKFFFDGRCMNGAAGIYSSYVHGTKGIGVASGRTTVGTPSAIYKGQNTVGETRSGNHRQQPIPTKTNGTS